jgi:hypothetical protein
LLIRSDAGHTASDFASRCPRLSKFDMNFRFGRNCALQVAQVYDRLPVVRRGVRTPIDVPNHCFSYFWRGQTAAPVHSFRLRARSHLSHRPAVESIADMTMSGAWPCVSLSSM